MKMKLVTTGYESGTAVTTTEEKEFTATEGREMQAVILYPEMTYQTFQGFGGAMTEASGYAYSCMSDENKQQILEAYFGENGNRYNLLRMHLDSCDFSVDTYEAMSDPKDREMNSFSLKRDEKYILPFFYDAKKHSVNSLEVMMTPWSPPAFMKTNNSRLNGGKLKGEYKEFWADYICRYIKEYLDKGIAVNRLTVQNEPHAVQTWDSCIFNNEEEKSFLRDYLFPALQKHQLDQIKLNIWDHNKDYIFDRACSVIDEETDKMVSGVAFHWYSGDHFEGVKLVHEKFPEKELIFTEGCVEYSRFAGSGQLDDAMMYAHDMIGNMNAGMNAFIDWNLLLDEKGGPNHVGNFCGAPIMCDTKNDSFEVKLAHTYIGHFSRYIMPGAVRIAYSKYTDKLEMTAFKNTDDSIAVVILNRSEEETPLGLRLNGNVMELNIAPKTISTGIITMSV